MSRVSADRECEWCTAAATWHVLAQWSLFDFDDRWACDEHTHNAIIMFARRWVDGSPVRELLVDKVEVLRDTWAG